MRFNHQKYSILVPCFHFLSAAYFCTDLSCLNSRFFKLPFISNLFTVPRMKSVCAFSMAEYACLFLSQFLCRALMLCVCSCGVFKVMQKDLFFLLHRVILSFCTTSGMNADCKYVVSLHFFNFSLKIGNPNLILFFVLLDFRFFLLCISPG